MTDDRSIERAARSWLEDGPTRAPDHAVAAALARIQTTHQERDWLPWRIRPMTHTLRLLAGAAAIAVVVAGGFVLSRPGPGVGGIAPATQPPQTTVAQYRAARDAICADLGGRRPTEPRPWKTDPEGAIAFLTATVAATNEEIQRLTALAVPAEIREDHLANIQVVRDNVALLGHEIVLLRNGKPDEALAVDEATRSLSAQFAAFEARYTLQPCPYG